VATARALRRVAGPAKANRQWLADVVKPLYSNAVGRWQGHERQLSPDIEKLEPVAEALGYRWT